MSRGHKFVQLALQNNNQLNEQTVQELISSVQSGKYLRINFIYKCNNATMLPGA